MRISDGVQTCALPISHLAGKSFMITPFDGFVMVGGELAMKFGIIKGLILGATLAAAPFAWAQDKVVNVYNWAEYTAPDPISGFEQATGIKVPYDVYARNDHLPAKHIPAKTETR